jgi:UDP-N-acetylmuramate--alanine ligase
MLGELLRGKSGIAVAGTHGKTTTTSMLGAIFSQAKSCQEDMDPTVIVGGKVAAFGGNARLGKSQWVIAEADESDGSFLLLPPTFALITNIDDDHLEYYGSMNKLRNAFQDFLGRIPFYGLAMLCGDDPGVRSILGEITKPFELYGFHPEWDWTMNRDGEVFYRASGYESPKKVGALKLRVPGRHNLLNALGAAALAYRLGISWGTIQLALENFQGAGRRFETRWRDEELGVWIVDDYGHHPTEILATLQAAKEMNAARIVTIFQPHRYSRTDQCFQGFRSAFSQTDVLVVTEIYGAGEEPIAGVDGAMLSEAIRSHPSSPREVVFLPDLETAARWVRDHHQRGDLTLTLGAGSITKLPKLIQMGWHDHRSS